MHYMQEYYRFWYFPLSKKKTEVAISLFLYTTATASVFFNCTTVLVFVNKKLIQSNFCCHLAPAKS